MDSLSYQETLDIVEKFMIDSEIRKWCETLCKGKCCGICQERYNHACQHYEKRRLSCSIYLCSKMYDILPPISREKIKVVDKCIIQQYNLFNKLTCCRKNKTLPKIFFEIIRFPITIKTDLKQINTETIRTRLKKLTEEDN